ncbi:MAG: DUF4835 family protein [Bacteroidales bacterium]|nr:DUF4835 family protein [Bacteroidales bacterium]
MKKIALFILLLIPFVSNSQEFNCRVSVDYSQITTTNIQIFQAMQRDINEFMNTTRWTNYVFNSNERIECSIFIKIIQFDGVDNFSATLQVALTRPIFDASLTSPVFNIKENEGAFKFQYIENQPIEFNENTYTSELAYSLAFYAYLILGFDFDTFSEYGGDEFFDMTQKIVSNAQSSPNQSVWKSIGTSHEDNRYYLAKFLTSANYRPYRQAQYKYHRLGLDMMVSDVTTARNNITESIELIKQVYQKKPGNFLVQFWIETKRAEIINIYSDAPPQEAKRVAQTLKLIDVTNADQYDKMGTGE